MRAGLQLLVGALCLALARCLCRFFSRAPFFTVSPLFSILAACGVLRFSSSYAPCRPSPFQAYALGAAPFPLPGLFLPAAFLCFCFRVLVCLFWLSFLSWSFRILSWRFLALSSLLAFGFPSFSCCLIVACFGLLLSFLALAYPMPFPVASVGSRALLGFMCPLASFSLFLAFSCRFPSAVSFSFPSSSRSLLFRPSELFPLAAPHSLAYLAQPSPVCGLRPLLCCLPWFRRLRGLMRGFPLFVVFSWSSSSSALLRHSG